MCMKKKILGFFAFFAFIICAALCAGFGLTTSSTALAQGTNPLGQRYLESRKETLGLAQITNSRTGITITQKQDTLISYLTISVNWELYSDIQIRRIVVNRASIVETDDTNTTITRPSDLTQDNKTGNYYFYTDGAYVVIATTADSEPTKIGIYSNEKFEREINLEELIIQNGNLSTNISYPDKNANIIIKSNAQNDLYIDFPSGYNPERPLYDAQLYSNNTVISTGTIASNLETVIKIHPNGKSNVTLLSTELEIFADLPSINFELQNGTAASEVVSEMKANIPSIDLPTSDMLYFNTTVVPVISTTNNSNLVNKRFAIFSTELDNGITRTSISTSDQSQTIEIYSTQYKVLTNPNQFITIKLGSETSKTIYESDNYLNGIFTATGIYPIANDLNKTTKYESFNGKMYVVLGNKGNTANSISTIDAAFALPWTLYSDSDAGTDISIQWSGSDITIANNFNDVPVDLVIVNEETGIQFEKPNIFNNNQEDTNTFKFSISAPGKYLIIAKYRGITLDSSVNYWYHRKQEITIYGTSISIKQGNNPIIDNQIVNGNVTVNCNAQYQIYKNSSLLGTYSANLATTLSESGYYTIVCPDNVTHFSIIETNQVLTQYSVSNFENVKPILISSSGAIIYPTGSYTILKQHGTYNIRSTITSSLQITINNEIETLTNEREFDYSVNIQPVMFNVTTDIKNGQKTSKNVVIQSIDAAGDWTVAINCNGKITNYTKEQFLSLNEKGRTLTKNGTYTITIQDANGNQFEFMFEKYFKMNAGLIVLIVIAACGLAVGIFFLIKIRFKSKVR